MLAFYKEKHARGAVVAYIERKPRAELVFKRRVDNGYVKARVGQLSPGAHRVGCRKNLVIPVAAEKRENGRCEAFRRRYDDRAVHMLRKVHLLPSRLFQSV